MENSDLKSFNKLKYNDNPFKNALLLSFCG